MSFNQPFDQLRPQRMFGLPQGCVFIFKVCTYVFLIFLFAQKGNNSWNNAPILKENVLNVVCQSNNICYKNLC